MKTLIPLSEYVELQLNTKQPTSEFKETVKNYTKFLRQPLTLSMFVPVDDEGNVLTEPKLMSELRYDIEDFQNKLIAYEIAKEKVLFEGFSFDSNVCMYQWGHINIYRFSNGNIKFFGISYSEEDRPSFWLKAIEDLVNLHDVTLTPSALKLIGVKKKNRI